ncbi:MAG: HEAT repeat domain-containing protein [Nitrospiraceae bacterium]
MRKSTSLVVLLVMTLMGTPSWGRRETLTPDQKAILEKADKALVEVIAITDKGAADAAPLAEVVTRRMKEMGYTIETDPARPHDVIFKVKCEQRKNWEGTTNMGSDADMPDSPSRVWKGPACQLTYLLEGKKMGWRKEVRTDFLDAQKAAEEAKADDPGDYAMKKLRERLEDYDFPAFVTAEWGQEDRLFKVFDDPATTSARKVKLISLFGYLFSTKSVPRLLDALKGPDLEVAKAAALALGNIGQKETIPTLIETMKSGNPELRAAAAKSLGVAATLHSDFSIIDPLLEALKTDDVGVKTEVVWALGKLPDRRAYEPLFALQKSLYKVRENDADPKLVKLKEAVNWSIKQIDTWEYLQ